MQKEGKILRRKLRVILEIKYLDAWVFTSAGVAIVFQKLKFDYISN